MLFCYLHKSKNEQLLYNRLYNILGKISEGQMETLVILILCGFVGFYVIKGVSHALHAPLMSITNAISSIIILGSIYAFNIGFDTQNMLILIFSILSIFIASINIGGGFTISSRMLSMFKKR